MTIKKESGVTAKTILFHSDAEAVGVVVSDAGTAAGSDGKKIVKAGMPLTGDLTARTTAFTLAATTDPSNAVGILAHDVDVTAGPANGTLYVKANINLNKIDATTVAKITAFVKTALAGRILFLK